MNLPLFLDSGAHGLYTEHVIKKHHEGDVADEKMSLRVKTSKSLRERGFDWYTTKEFWDYVDKYAEFLHSDRAKHIEVYANVDVIFNPKLTWDVQRYMEKEHGLHPLPVIHYGTPLRWLERYVDHGYEYIALGGLGQEATKSKYLSWADGAFRVICNQPSFLPKCKVHGFAISSHQLIVSYPWYSVDSSKWVKQAGFGYILMPPWDGQRKCWDYRNSFLTIRVSGRSGKSGLAMAMEHTVQRGLRKLFDRYMEEKGYKLGKSEITVVDGKETEQVIEDGICNNVTQRSAMNLLYFIDLSNSLPKWPWPFALSKNRAHTFNMPLE